MRVVASAPAARLIDESGGRLYVWPTRPRCCGAVTTLRTSSTPPKGAEFRLAAVGDGFDVFVPAGLARLPEELHLESRRFPRRVDAYWNGCAWVV
jgi:hypothetical protein